jgi:hypothetical protein
MCNKSEVRQYKFKQRLNKSGEAKAQATSTEEKPEAKEATAKTKPTLVKLLTSKK